MVFKDSIYTVFFQHNPSPMYVYDSSSLEILDVNNAALQQYGYSREEFKNLHLKDIRSPEQRLALMQSVAVSPTHSGNAGIWKHKDKNGKEFFVEILVETCNHENRILKIVQAREISRGTEEKELRQAAQKETKYHLENTALGIIEWDKQFRVQHISSRITEISGYAINELINMHALDLAAKLVVERDLYLVRHSIDMLANGKATKNTFDLRFSRKDGTIASTRWYNSALRNQDNQLVSVMSIVEDLTDQVQAERALTEEKERFRLLAENSSDVISRHHLDGTFLYVSPAIERLLGFRPEEIVGKWVYDFFHPDDIPDIKKIHQALLLSADDNKMTHRYKTKSGSYKWVETIGKAIRDPVTNEILEVHTSTRDISDRKKLEDKLITEKELLRTAIESMSGIFYMLDEQQRYILWNKNLEQSLGYSSEEIEQMHPLDFYREEDHEMIASKIEEVLDVGETNIEVDLFGKNGQYRRYYITGRVFENEGKKYVVGSGIDISERLEYEKELKQTIHDKQILLQEVHHRVKNNLAVISGLLELQKTFVDLPNVHRVLLESQLRIKSMAFIHERLYESKSMSRIEFDQIIDKITGSVQNSLDPEKKITIQSDCCSLLLNINQAVPCALIINELVSNTIEHAFPHNEKGTISLKISQKDDLVSVSINDDGHGLPEEFLKEDTATLGYTIVHTLIKQLNANLKMNNRTIFSFKKKDTKGSSSGIIES